MTATDRLRALLDERGVEHSDRETSTSFGCVGFTQWGKQEDELDGVRWMCSADSRPGGGLLVLVRCDDFEQARGVIDATIEVIKHDGDR